MDTLTPEQRSERMSRVRSKDSKPELAVRRLVHGLGYRYRLHRRDLPGTPDLVFVGLKRVIFVHGCFWHQHPGCKNARMPKSRQDFWPTKLAANVARDERHLRALRELGWKTMVVWECELGDLDHLSRRIRRFLDSTR